MNPVLPNLTPSVLLVSLALAVPRPAPCQLIGVRTVPVATGDQFSIFPAERSGMGGVSIALDDPLLDPFVNPAKGANLSASLVFSAPMFYDITNYHGSARTLPVGLLLRSPAWFGGGAAAVQQILPGGTQFYPVPLATADARSGSYPVPYYPAPRRAQSNMYGFGLLGRSFAGGRTTLAASAFLSDLSAVDGVDMLYPGSQSLDQYGHSEDYRLGLLQQLGGDRSLALLLLHDRFTMTHDVTYVTYVLQPCPLAPDTVPPGCPVPQARNEHNLDWTRTWGLHAEYRQPLTKTGWRIGGILTANYKDHPHIPNYDLMNIPRDPGTTWAFNAGVGLLRTNGPVQFGMDVIYEPIWSHTWATTGGCPPGAFCLASFAPPITSVDNHFRFSNSRMRMGVARDGHPVGFQLGLDVYSVSYVLNQLDRLQGTSRRQHESWMEWTPAWGLSLKFPELTVRYAGRLTTGTGQPGVAWGGGFVAGRAAMALSDYVIAPSGPMTLQDATVITHQVSVVLPIR